MKEGNGIYNPELLTSMVSAQYIFANHFQLDIVQIKKKKGTPGPGTYG
jgi:hypothetical protein